MIGGNPPLPASFMSYAAIAAILALAASGCAHSRSSDSRQSLAPCTGTPTLTVHNNTVADVEVYESRAGMKNVIATVAPGTHKITLTNADPQVAYGAQPVGGSDVVAVTSRPRTSDPVTFERSCE